jgi:hypothetical protein
MPQHGSRTWQLCLYHIIVIIKDILPALAGGLLCKMASMPGARTARTCCAAMVASAA